MDDIPIPIQYLLVQNDIVPVFDQVLPKPLLLELGECLNCLFSLQSHSYEDEKFITANLTKITTYY